MQLSQIILFGASLVFLTGCVTGHAEAIFGNSTYQVENWKGDAAVTLANGRHEEDGFSVYYENRFVYGDFNRDGLRDAAVIISENQGGNQNNYILAFLTNDGQRLVHTSSIYLDDRPLISYIRADKDKVLIDMCVHQPGDSMGGPSRRVREWYAYPGSGISADRIGSYVFGEGTSGVKGKPDPELRSPRCNSGFTELKPGW